MVFPKVNIIDPLIRSRGEAMELQYSERDNHIRLIKLTGRLDIDGKAEIETKFAGYCSGEKARVVVDLSGVDFLASIGIRHSTSHTHRQIGHQPRREDGVVEPNARRTKCSGNHWHPGNHSYLF